MDPNSSAKTNDKDRGCGHDAPALSLADALAQVLAVVVPVKETETRSLREALGSVLCGDVRSDIDVPAHTNSAMDGYALSGESLPTNGDKTFKVIGTAWAGKPFAGKAESDQCVRIMTGAPLPAATDTVVMQEHVSRDGDNAIIGDSEQPGQHVRPAGEDISAGSVALSASTVLDPAHIGVLASIGVESVNVFRRPRVAFFSTGDELREVGEPLADGQIYDSNRYTLFGMLSRLGADIVDRGVVGDRPEELKQAFVDASDSADMIITTGGVSVGDADFVPEILAELGNIEFWSVAMKPGRPVTFGTIRGKYFFGLPGNPVSVMATFYHLVQPALLRLAGAEAVDTAIRVMARCETAIRKQPGRMEFQRGILSRDASGEYSVIRAGQQGSGILRSMTTANCFIVLPADLEEAPEGAMVEVQPFLGLV